MKIPRIHYYIFWGKLNYGNSIQFISILEGNRRILLSYYSSTATLKIHQLVLVKQIDQSKIALLIH